MSKINFSQGLILFDGKPLLTSPEDATPTTLKDIVSQALLQPQQDDGMKPGLNYKLFTLAHMIKEGGDVEVQAADVDLMKSRVEVVFSPMIVGLTWDALEGRSEPDMRSAGLVDAPAFSAVRSRGRKSR